MLALVYQPLAQVFYIFWRIRELFRSCWISAREASFHLPLDRSDHQTADDRVLHQPHREARELGHVADPPRLAGRAHRGKLTSAGTVRREPGTDEGAGQTRHDRQRDARALPDFLDDGHGKL